MKIANSTLQAPYVLLDDCLKPDAPATLYSSSDFIITADSFDQISEAFEEIEKARSEGYYLAGWFAYEILGYFEPKLAPAIKLPKEPLIWLVATKNPKSIPNPVMDSQQIESAFIVNSKAQTTLEIYQQKFETVQNFIEAGDVYQINYTFAHPLKVIGEPYILFQHLKEAQPVSYAALINTGDNVIYSLSPELFFQRCGGHITTKPMKGTSPRGVNDESDIINRDTLLADHKNRAENLMIVDLLRNDLSRIAKDGSVKVKALYEVEPYPTLHQMTSTITANVNNERSFYELMKALFPCGSVTGAPKVRAMEIINELEDSTRGVYCGAIGVIEPSGDCCFNVPIRTIITDSEGNGRINIGSGIVADSNCLEEWEECKLKSKFIDELHKKHDLFETLLWLPDKGFMRLEKHLDRMVQSANHFMIPIDIAALRNALKQHVKDLQTSHRVKLILETNGTHSVSSDPIESRSENFGSVILVKSPYDKRDALLQHKTTRRIAYDELRAQYSESHGVTDVIFYNDEMNITEGAISNIFITIDKTLYTPPISDGCLPGVMRQSILEDDNYPTIERSLSIGDLKKASKIYISNSLRGLRGVKLIDSI